MEEEPKASNNQKRKAGGGGGGRMFRQRKKIVPQPDDITSDKYRDFKWVHANVLAEKVTLAVYSKGIKLSPVTDKNQANDDESAIGWDMVSKILTHDREGPVLTLKHCFETLSSLTVDFISKKTECYWGYAHCPVEQHLTEVLHESFAYITTALISTTHDKRTAKICDAVYHAMTAQGALAILRRNPYYEKLRTVKTEVASLWGDLPTAKTVKDMEAEYSDIFAKETDLYAMFKIIVKASEGGRYARIVQIVEADEPHEKLLELGDLKETVQIMKMSPNKDKFSSYLAKTAVNFMSVENISRPKIIFPPRIDCLIDDAKIKLEKNPVFQKNMRSALGIDADSPEIASEQSVAATQLVSECFRLVCTSIYKQRDITAWSEEDFMKAMPVKTESDGETEIGLIPYTDRCLEKIHAAHKLSTAYKNIQWKELIVEMNNSIQASVHDSISSYINTHKVVVLKGDGFGEQEYSPIAVVFQFMVNSMFATDEEFEKIKSELGKPARMDKVASEKCVPIALTLDHVDADHRKEVLEKIYKALQRTPAIVHTFGSKFLFYIRKIDLTANFIVHPLYAALKDEVFGKKAGLMTCAPYLARDFLFLLCRAAGHPDAATFTVFAEKIGVTMVCDTTRSRFIFQEPKEGSDKYHEVDMSAIGDVFIVDETQTISGEEGASKQQPAPLVNTGFKVSIHSTAAKKLADFSKEKILSALDDEDIQYVADPHSEEEESLEGENGDKDTSQVNHTTGSKPIPDNQFLDADAKAEIHFLIHWIHQDYIKGAPVTLKQDLLHGIYAAIPRLEKKIIFAEFSNKSQYTTRIISHMVSVLDAVDLHKDNKEKLKSCTAIKTANGKGKALPFTRKLKIVLEIIQGEWGMTEPTALEEDDVAVGAGNLVGFSANKHHRSQQSNEEDDDEHMATENGSASDSGSGNE
jgi:hypothetical protein